MALKGKLTKVEYDALPDALKAEYKADGDNFVLDVVGAEDIGALRRAKDREALAAKTEKERADALQAQLDAVIDPKKSADIKALETSWQNKLTTEVSAKEKVITDLTAALQKTIVSDQAARIAAELAPDSATILIPHIAKRLAAEIEGSEAKTRVLDASGKPSALSIEDLKKEFVDNKEFSKIIVVSKGSGGAGSKRTTSSAVPKDKKFGDLSEAERVAWATEDKEGFIAARDEWKQSQRKF